MCILFWLLSSVLWCFFWLYMCSSMSRNLQQTPTEREIPSARSVAIDMGNISFCFYIIIIINAIITGKQFLVVYDVGNENHSRKAALCLLCERELSDDEFCAHVFSREHVARFLVSVRTSNTCMTLFISCNSIVFINPTVGKLHFATAEKSWNLQVNVTKLACWSCSPNGPVQMSV